MSDATLQLSQHELYFLPPGTPATSPATRVEVEVRGEKFWITVRLECSGRVGRAEQYRVFWRPEGVEDARVFVSQVTVEAGPDAERKAISRIRQSIDMGSVRLWRAPDAPFGVEVSTENYGRIEWRKDGERLAAETFDWEPKWTNREFANLSQIEFVELLQAAYADEDSSLWQTLRWQALTRDQKNGVAFGCENGDWQKLRRLFACAQIVIYCECGPFPYLREVTQSKPTRDGKPVFSVYERNWRWFFDESLQAKQLDSRERGWQMRWQNAICQIARPKFWPHEPIYTFNWRRSHADYDRCYVESAMPTRNQALEAGLELREFLRPHLPESEFEALLRPE